MADLFTVTAPLLIRNKISGDRHVMAEFFPHPQGLLFFELFWHQKDRDQSIHLVEGTLDGNGPWKIGDCVITVLGCQNTNPELAIEFDAWQHYMQTVGNEYPGQTMIQHIAKQRGADIL